MAVWGNIGPFTPHPLLRSGHLQTLAGLFQSRFPIGATARHVIEVSCGDRLALHDDKPDGWRNGGPVALLVHGLAGSHASNYMVRLAHKLLRKGIRAFRLDQRACGDGYLLAAHPFHSGRSADIAAALNHIAGLTGSEVALVAFSLGANTALKWAGEAGRSHWPARRVIAVSPPVDLSDCVDRLERFPARIYDRHFVTRLLGQVANHPQFRTHRFARRPRCLREFDDAFTAPRCGFADAASYYRACSAGPLLGAITVPTLILYAQDDPIVAHRPLETAPGNVIVRCTANGGHLGFIGAGGSDPDRRWLDWRILEQVTAPLPDGKTAA
jgi:predicted alpha/beta-fold hydrolase